MMARLGQWHMKSYRHRSDLRARLRAFVRNKAGNVATTFALAAIPLMAVAGAALDFARLGDAEARVQAVLDSAVMAAAAPRGMAANERTDVAAKYFADNYQPASSGDDRPVPKFVIKNGVLKGEVADKVKALLMPVLGLGELSFTAKSEVKLRTMKAAEIVLALDYSSSMLDNDKWKAMRGSAIKLVEELSGGTNNPSLRFGLVPFAGHVYTTLNANFVKGAAAGVPWTNCTTDRKYPYNTHDTTPNQDVDDSKWGQNFASYSGECSSYASRKLVIRRLTSDATAIKQQLNDMSPHYGTHIALGFEFARHLLSPNQPYNDGVDYSDKDTKKIIILLTDGEQTSGGWGENGHSSKSSAEKNTEVMCKAAKDQGVMIFTIAFDINSGGTRKRLEDCASSSDFYFDARTNSSLASAFDSITGTLVNSPYFQR
jgi:Flp pilus assembly protein TadG